MTDYREATDDQLIAELESRGRFNDHHVLQANLADFTLSHTLHCYPNLFECSVHKLIEAHYMKHSGIFDMRAGQYKVFLNDDMKSIRFEVIKWKGEE